MNAISSAYSGLQMASQQMNTAASNIASGDLSPGNAVSMITAKTDFSANVAMMKVAKNMDDELVHMVDKFA